MAGLSFAPIAVIKFPATSYVIKKFVTLENQSQYAVKPLHLFLIGLLLAFPSLTMSAQELDGYKYVYVNPLTYENGPDDMYGLEAQVKTSLMKKGFTLITAEEREVPESKEMVYAVLDCKITHTTFPKSQNKVSILLSDVTGRGVWSAESWSGGNNLQSSLKRAAIQVLRELEKLPYRYDPSQTPKPFVKKKMKMDWKEPKPEWNEEAVRAYLDSSKTLDPIEGIYKSTQNDRTKYYRIGVVKDGLKYKAYILETDSPLWEPGEVKCTFEPASAGLYSVTWYMSNKRRMDVFGKLYANGLLEIGISDDTQTSQNFLRIYPQMSSSLAPNASPTIPSPANGSAKSWKPIGGGTGFFVSKNGYIATNNHVIKEAHEVNVSVLDPETGTYKRYTAEIRIQDPDNDLAIIRIDDPDFKPLLTLPYTIEPSANIGAEVFTIGYPLDGIMGENYKVTNGIISAKTGARDNVKKYQITVPIQSGNSGGPLFDKNGNVVGVTTSSLDEKAVRREYQTDKVENVNYAVKSLYLLTVIDSLPVIDDLPTSSALVGKSLEDQVKVLRFYVCNILTR